MRAAAWETLKRAHPHLHDLMAQHQDDPQLKQMIEELLNVSAIDAFADKAKALAAAYPEFGKHMANLSASHVYEVWDRFLKHRALAKQVFLALY
jgi:hypothetical protein